ncbi:DUF6512 family protein [Desnuesiella massiliensis]|uniref:DUF6512 family protein n=1 Tax=Desnuesiella massiliensis TaxID=1650662 RepID=UPI001FA6E320|nr:DUF6512 family protein [Desnuesiella massiliensis]
MSQPEKWIMLGIPALFIIGSIMHFAYDLTGKIALIGIFSPINESIWEHLKMVLIPIIAWWGAYYGSKGKKYNINKERWFWGTVISIISSMVIIVAFYYTYTQATGIESLALDIFDLFLGIAVGQCLGLHIYKYSKGINIYVSICIMILLIVVFGIFTFNPLYVPLFKDGSSGKYGL